MANHQSIVFNLLVDRLKELGYHISDSAEANDVYSSKISRDGTTFDMKCIFMGSKGIIHAMMDGNLKSTDFDVKDLLIDGSVDATRMQVLLSKLDKGVFQQLKATTKTTEYGTRSQFGIGDKDLDPLAATSGMIPPFGGIGSGSGGGMIMDPSHPLFTQPPGVNPFGSGPMSFPPGSIPPGVRFDPVTPLGPRFPMGARPPGRQGFPRGSGPWSGEPDQDEFLPPGNDNMYM